MTLPQLQSPNSDVPLQISFPLGEQVVLEVLGAVGYGDAGAVPARYGGTLGAVGYGYVGAVPVGYGGWWPLDGSGIRLAVG